MRFDTEGAITVIVTPSRYAARAGAYDRLLLHQIEDATGGFPRGRTALAPDHLDRAEVTSPGVQLSEPGRDHPRT